MSMEFGWRRFNFFDKQIVFDPEKPDEKFLGLKDVCIECWCAAGDYAYLGETRGGVFRLHKRLQQFFWKAYFHKLSALHTASHFLFSLGEDSEGDSVLKIWDLDRLDETSVQSVREIRMQNIVASSAVCSLAVHSTFTTTVIGTEDGQVFLFQGDIIQDKNVSKWLRIRDASLDGAITGLAISQLAHGRQLVFVITNKSLHSIIVDNKTVTSKNKHESSGASKDCWTFDERTSRLIVGSKDMIHIYDVEQCVDGGEGRCYQLSRGHEKLQLVAYGENLALLTKQQAVIKHGEFMSMLTVYNLSGQYISFSCALPSLCRLFTIGQIMMVLSPDDGTLNELREKSLTAKLDFLIKKNLFDVAIGLAKSESGGDSLKSIHAKYGDYLYQKGDFENAIKEYKETIGLLEPSYVIKRFVDGSRMHQLCLYLEALHYTQRHTPQHTNILLNTYIRLGEKAKMMQFVEKLAHTKNADVPAMLEVLRSGGYAREASVLATKLHEHEQAVAAIVGDLHNYRLAVEYIGKRPPKETVKYLEKYGRELLKHSPNETTALLMDIFELATKDKDIDVLPLVTLLTKDSFNQADLVQNVVESSTSSNKSLLNHVLIELRLRQFSEGIISEEDCFSSVSSLIGADPGLDVLQLAYYFDCASVVEYVLKIAKREIELLQYYVKKGKFDEAIQMCKETEGNELWNELLCELGKSPKVTDADLEKFLKSVELSSAIPPLLVLDVLSRNNSICISAVKPYITNWLGKKEEEIVKKKKTIEENEKKIQEMERQTESLQFNSQVLQVSKCSACDTALQLPSVHFLCRHSYHVHCFESYTDHMDKCPACAIRDSSRPQATANYEAFQKEIDTAARPIDVLSKYLAMRLFSDDGERKLKHSTSRSSSTYDDEKNPFTSSIDPPQSSGRSINLFDEPPNQSAGKQAQRETQSRGRGKPVNTNPFEVDD